MKRFTFKAQMSIPVIIYNHLQQITSKRDLSKTLETYKENFSTVFPSFTMEFVKAKREKYSYDLIFNVKGVFDSDRKDDDKKNNGTKFDIFHLSRTTIDTFNQDGFKKIQLTEATK